MELISKDWFWEITKKLLESTCQTVGVIAREVKFFLSWSFEKKKKKKNTIRLSVKNQKVRGKKKPSSYRLLSSATCWEPPLIRKIPTFSVAVIKKKKKKKKKKKQNRKENVNEVERGIDSKNKRERKGNNHLSKVKQQQYLQQHREGPCRSHSP